MNSSGDLIIRPMNLDDVSAVHRIDEISFSLPWTERSFRFELTENPSSSCWVAEVPDSLGFPQVVGMLVIWLIVDEAHIGSIAIHPDYRRQGIGRKLLVQALVEAARKGAVESTLEVRRGNIPAQTMYRQLGFSVVGVRPRYYRDNGEDALLMTLHNLDPEKLQEIVESVQKG